MKKNSLYFFALIFISIVLLAFGVQYFADLSYPKYGVFIGANPSDTLSFAGYDILVIDAEQYTKTEIEILKMKNRKIYSYLNIGSIEKFRKCYRDFHHIALGPYANWPDEEWVDVSNPDWQKYILEFAANEIASKGIDGFWVDNTDVYYFFPRKEILDGIVQLINRLNLFNLDLIINGGNQFIEEAILDSPSPRCQIDGINQEFVFTSYDFKQMKAIPAVKWEKEYYLDYLNRLTQLGLDVYITEYEDFSIEKELSDYCKQRNWQFFLSPSINLDREAR